LQELDDLSQQPIVQGQHLTLSLTAWGRLGEAMASHQGQDVFVFGGIPGETVVAEVLRVRRKYVAASVVEVLEASEQRVAPLCPYYGDCTGCQWQHLDYPAQLAAKHERVVDALSRVGGFSAEGRVLPVLPSPSQYGYRNHARFTVGKAGELGFVNRETRQFVPIDHCLLMHGGINQLLSQLQDKCDETTQLSIRAGAETGDYLVQPTLKNPQVPIATGQKHYLDSVEGRSFRVASPSFFQVNIEQAAQLAQTVRHTLALQEDETLVDAYAGVGTFAALLSPYVRRVIAIEESSAAVEDARENCQGLDNVEFVLGKTEEVMGHLDPPPDVVVLDPPRAGCRPQALESLIRLGPRRIAYVSCDPETLARDLKALCDGPYRLEQVQPVDMFPQTHHVECIASLSHTGLPAQNGARNRSSDAIVLASASPRRRDLLTEMGVDFEVAPSGVPEDPIPGESPSGMVERLSRDKAQEIARQRDEGYIIAADSLVALDGQVLGKPADADDARRMLWELWGRDHHVVTGVTVINASTGESRTDSVMSPVAMRRFSKDELEASVASGYPLDKAGAYAIQDPEFRPALLQSGCYTNVLGLPLCRLAEMLGELGYQLPSGRIVPSCAQCLEPCPYAGEGPR
jgi:23S rRNA (uracil1939-C5)-methyltransferase